MRILVLCHQDLVPPNLLLSDQKIENKPWRTEAFVGQALIKNGHNIEYCGLKDDLSPLKKKLKKFNPQLVFNLLEEFADEGLLEHFAVSYLENVGQPYSGCSSEALILCKNKILAKTVMKSHGVLVPGNSKYPKIVKLVDEESSRGLDSGSIVASRDEELAQRAKLRCTFRSEIFVENYIAGRELHVAVIKKNKKFLISPVWETSFGLAKNKILTEKNKWNFTYRNKNKIQLKLAEKLSPELIKKIQSSAIKCCRALSINSYARVDIRLSEGHKAYVIEVNPNPDLAKFDEFSECIKSMSIPYEELIELIVEQGLKK